MKMGKPVYATLEVALLAKHMRITLQMTAMSYLVIVKKCLDFAAERAHFILVQDDLLG